MTRINLTKYGFVRWPEEDFSDDGNRFTCYKVGKQVRVSKLISHGDAYISARIDSYQIPYEVYSKLPCYRDLDALNGVSLSSITEDDLQKLYEDCLTYEAAFEKAISEIKWPSIEEIRTKQLEMLNAYSHAYEYLKYMIATNIGILVEKASEYEWTSLKKNLSNYKEYLTRYSSETFAENRYQTSSSFDFIKKDAKAEAEHNYYYETILEMVNKYCY